MTDKNELTVDESPSGHLHETPMVVELGEEFGVEPKQIIKVLRSIIKVPSNEPPATPAELIIALSVMRQYNMNPMMKQLHVWRDNRGELAVMAGYDFWTQKANEQPGFQYVSYEVGPEVPSPDGKGNSCWEWVKATVHDSIRGKMEMFPVYLEEWYQKQNRYAGPWQKQTRHKIHIVAYRLAIREAYSIAMDIRDPSDFDAGPAYGGGASATVDKLNNMTQTAYEDADAEVVDADQGSMDGVTPPDVPCGVVGCATGATMQCAGCQAMFCPTHLDTDLCGICALDGE